QTRQEVLQLLLLGRRRPVVLPGLDERVFGMPLRQLGVPVVADRVGESDHFVDRFREFHGASVAGMPGASLCGQYIGAARPVSSASSPGTVHTSLNGGSAMPVMPAMNVAPPSVCTPTEAPLAPWTWTLV